MTSFTLTARLFPDGAPFTVTGRTAWALDALVKAGPKGCTPIDTPGPRWSSYVHRLRRDHGLAIETHHENHGGPFPGAHGRYVLTTPVEIVSRSDGGQAVAA